LGTLCPPPLILSVPPFSKVTTVQGYHFFGGQFTSTSSPTLYLCVWAASQASQFWVAALKCGLAECRQQRTCGWACAVWLCVTNSWRGREYSYAQRG
jgi:hypothetical protein